MATNECNRRGENLTIAVPSAPNSGVGPNSGDPLIIGTGTSPNFGVFFLSVVGQLDSHGGGNLAINPGDRVYADNNGTRDATTGVYYGFTLNGSKTSGIYFGNALDAVVSGATTTIRVRLKVGG